MDSPAASAAGPVPDRGPQTLRVIWALTPLAAATTVLRVVSRVRGRRFGWDDVFMVLSTACFLGWSVVLTLYAQRGGLRHIDDVATTGVDNVVTVLLLNWLSQPFGIIGVAAGKISVSALLLGIIRMTGLRWHRLFLWAVPIMLAAVVAVACSVLTFAQCSPPDALWDKRVEGRCIDPHVMSGFGTFTGGFNTFADASLAIVPATIFWQLKSTTTEKAQLTIVFGLNILTSICSGIKTQYLVELANRTDQTWATYDIFVWVTGELFLMIVCGTIPTLHLVLGWFRAAAAAARGCMAPRGPFGKRSQGSSAESGRGPEAELGDLTHMHVKTKTTVERARAAASESLDRLVDGMAVPRQGVRVEVMYDVRRDTRPDWAQSNSSA